VIEDTAKICIVVPVRNRPDMVSRLIDCFNNSEADDLEQVWVDDAGDEETRGILLDHVGKHGNAQYLRNTTQQLFTRTLNRGIRAAEPSNDLYTLVNTDCVLKPGWLALLAKAHMENPGSAIIGYPDGRPSGNGEVQQAFYPSRGGAPDYITGHCFMVPRWAFLESGLFCETDLQQAHIGSERLWCWRACGSPPYGFGNHMFYVNSDLCVHDEGGASWGRSLEWLYSFDVSSLWSGRDEM
jgi:GT2 family glycosyltransferase